MRSAAMKQQSGGEGFGIGRVVKQEFDRQPGGKGGARNWTLGDMTIYLLKPFIARANQKARQRRQEAEQRESTNRTPLPCSLGAQRRGAPQRFGPQKRSVPLAVALGREAQPPGPAPAPVIWLCCGLPLQAGAAASALVCAPSHLGGAGGGSGRSSGGGPARGRRAARCRVACLGGGVPTGPRGWCRRL